MLLHKFVVLIKLLDRTMSRNLYQHGCLHLGRIPDANGERRPAI